MPPPSRCWRGLSPCASAPGMYIGGTDERALHHLVAEVLDNSMDEAVAGHASRIEVELHADHSVTIRDNGRGHPRGSASQVSRQERSGGDPLHAARGRQVLGQGLPDLRRPAWRGCLGRQRAVGSPACRGRPQPRAFRAGVFARHPAGARPFRGRCRQPARHLRHLPRRRADLRLPPVQAGAAPEDGALQGLPFLRRGNPLEIRHRRRRDTGRGHFPFPRWPLGLPQRDHRRLGHLYRRALRRKGGVPAQVRRPRLRRMGDHLDARARRVHPVLLQHRAHARGRHA